MNDKRLQEALQQARARWKGEQDKAASLESMALSLSAVIDHLHMHQPETAEDLGPLLALLGSLGDLSKGSKAPLLQPLASPPGRPPTSETTLQPLAMAAAAVDLFMDTGMGLDDSCRRVADRLQREGLPLPADSHNKAPCWRRLKDWREKMRRGQRGGLPRDSYRWVLHLAREEGHDAEAILDVTSAQLGNR